jgi:hypothetical protein
MARWPVDRRAPCPHVRGRRGVDAVTGGAGQRPTRWPRRVRRRPQPRTRSRERAAWRRAGIRSGVPRDAVAGSGRRLESPHRSRVARSWLGSGRTVLSDATAQAQGRSDRPRATAQLWEPPRWRTCCLPPRAGVDRRRPRVRRPAAGARARRHGARPLRRRHVRIGATADRPDAGDGLPRLCDVNEPPDPRVVSTMRPGVARSSGGQVVG